MSEKPAFALEFRPPSENLKDFVSSYYHFRAPALNGPQMEPADRAQLRFLLAGEGGYEFCDGVYCEAAPVSLIGPTSGPTTGRVTGAVEIFGVGLQPAGWGTLMGNAAEQLTDRLLDAAELFGEHILRLHGEISAVPDIDAKIAVVEPLLGEVLKAGDCAPVWFTRLVDVWLVSSASPQVADLAQESGLSARKLERMMNRYYGGPPRMIARKYRALKASSGIVRRDSDAVVADGFYDQSHLTRELKQFTGATPGATRDAPSDIQRAVLERRKALAGKVGRLISDT